MRDKPPRRPPRLSHMDHFSTGQSGATAATSAGVITAHSHGLTAKRPDHVRFEGRTVLSPQAYEREVRAQTERVRCGSLRDSERL
ncbi:MAG: hypothetical protein LBQ00_09410 [Syntrophobacterales bacterium]|nr:hypothetical protein [Syntrophobacterales bacterium]